jgi:hypothetical protein
VCSSVVHPTDALVAPTEEAETERIFAAGSMTIGTASVLKSYTGEVISTAPTPAGLDTTRKSYVVSESSPVSVTECEVVRVALDTFSSNVMFSPYSTRELAAKLVVHVIVAPVSLSDADSTPDMTTVVEILFEDPEDPPDVGSASVVKVSSPE